MLFKKSFSTFLFLLVLLLATATALAANSQSISFKSADGILITADSYTPHAASSPLILLFHQAGSSRGEYNEIAPRLNELGFNCIAVDLRSGEFSRGKDNQTAIHASNAGLPTRYADALPDIIAALNFANTKYINSKIIIWGSSYSASLVLKLAGDLPEQVDGVIAFSPGEYFSHQGKSKTWITNSAINIKAPTFITSSKNEADSWKLIYQAITSKTKSSFIPTTAGRHGSRALWSKYGDSANYWQALTVFLKTAGFIHKN